MTVFRLMGNNGFTTEDYPEPEVWAEVLRDAGLIEFEYFADHIEPVLFWPVIRDRTEFWQATVEAIEQYGLRPWSGATARVSYLMNLMSHPYPDMRRLGVEWCKRFIDLARGLGCKYISGHYDCMSKRQLAEAFDETVEKMIDGLVEASEYGAGVGLEAIFLEQMHRPQLQPNTIDRAQDILARANERSAIPIRMHLDTGHAAHVSPAVDPQHTARDKDVYEWMKVPWTDRRMVLVHTQQTDEQASRHWPFTPQYNDRGILDARKAIDAMETSGVEEWALALEILFPRGTLIEEIKEGIVSSADYWRDAFQQAGYGLGEDNLYRKAGPTAPSAPGS